MLRFHGSKIVVMGEGGVFTTNDEALYNRAKFLADVAKHPTKRFFNDEIGYKFRLSNLQAAFGTARMERLEEIVSRKRQIFQWYQEELDGIEGLELNPQLPDIRNNYWMVTPVLDARWEYNAEWLLAELDKRAVSGRPFFYRLTDFPMYQKFRRESTPVAQRLHERGLNLPCGAELTQEEVKYVCTHLRNILTGEKGPYPIMGWLARREQFWNKECDFPEIQFIHPDFHAMDCEISMTKPEALTTELLESIHETLGFKRLFIRASDADNDWLKGLGFIEHQRIPMVQTVGCSTPFELFRQPYTDIQTYEIIFMRVF